MNGAMNGVGRWNEQFFIYSCLLTSSLLLLSSNATRWLCTYFRRTITISSLVMERARMNLRVPATKAALLYRMRVELLCNKIEFIFFMHHLHQLYLFLTFLFIFPLTLFPRTITPIPLLSFGTMRTWIDCPPLWLVRRALHTHLCRKPKR